MSNFLCYTRFIMSEIGGEDVERLLNEILKHNKRFVEDKEYIAYTTSKIPNKKLVILSCMDTRLTELLLKAMQLKNGDAKIIKNAGATIVHPFGSVVRSILVAVYEFGTEDIMIVGHTGCGMSGLNPQVVIEKMYQRHIPKERLDLLSHAGVNVEQWLKGFETVEQSILESVDLMRNHPLLPTDVHVHGLLIDSVTGEIRVLDNGYLR